MSKILAKWMKHKQRGKRKFEKPLSAPERMALHKIRREAKLAGAILKSNGKGGLPPSLVLTVFRRDEFTCKVHGDKGEGEHGGLEVHHKGGIVESKWLSEKGHKNVPNNLVTVCAKAHDELHEKARAEGVDSSQVEPEGDKK